MEVKVYIKGDREPILYSGDRIDVLDYSMDNIQYKQIRYFRKGFSKSELIEESMIQRIEECKE